MLGLKQFFCSVAAASLNGLKDDDEVLMVKNRTRVFFAGRVLSRRVQEEITEVVLQLGFFCIETMGFVWEIC